MKYQPRLDGLRGIAILMVLLEHFAGFIGRPISAGFYGVNLFFVLSGFLITSILIREDNRSFGKRLVNFLAKRSLRIFPIYYLVIFLLYIFQAPSINERLVYLLTYTYNYQLAFLNFPEDPYRAVWSLAVEEQFYLFFPLIALSLKKNMKLFLFVCFMFLVIASMQLFFNYFSISKYDYTGLLTNMAPLSLGALGAIAHKNKIVMRGGKYFEVGLLILLLLVDISVNLKYQIIFWGIINLYFILKASQGNIKLRILEDLLLNRKLILIGRISYGIYLYHGLINYYFTKYIFNPVWLNIPFGKWGIFARLEFHSWILKFPIYSFFSISLAILSFRYIETPFLKMKEKFA